MISAHSANGSYSYTSGVIIWTIYLSGCMLSAHVYIARHSNVCSKSMISGSSGQISTCSRKRSRTNSSSRLQNIIPKRVPVVIIGNKAIIGDQRELIVKELGLTDEP